MNYLLILLALTTFLAVNALDCNKVEIDCRIAADSPPRSAPFQIAMPSDDHKGLIVNSDGLKKLMKIKQNISVLGKLSMLDIERINRVVSPKHFIQLDSFMLFSHSHSTFTSLPSYYN